MSTIEQREKRALESRDPQRLIALARTQLRENRPNSALKSLRLAHKIDASSKASTLIVHVEQTHGVIYVTEKEYDKIVRRFQAGRGSWARKAPLPRQRKKRAVLLHYLLHRFFVPARIYDEYDANSGFAQGIQHLSLETDYCHLRRYMQELKLIGRSRDGREYWINDQPSLFIER